MVNRFILWVMVAVVGSGAWAHAAERESGPAVESRLLKPAQLDLRVTADTDVLLVYLELGLGADWGLLPLGPGTLSVGGELDVGLCASACLALSALTGFQWGQRFVHPYARLAYHLPIPGAQTLSKADVYGLGMVGLVMTDFGVSSPDQSIRVTGSDAALALGLGAGANYFVTDRFFIGLEGRLRYATGRYKWKVEVGQYSISDEHATWDLSGLNAMVFAGARL